MTDVNAILAQQLAEALSQGDRPRQVALAASMLKERGADVARLQQIISEAATELVRENQEKDLEAAAQWAQTWHRHTRQAGSKELWTELQERIDSLRADEERVRAALTTDDPQLLHGAINDLECETGRLVSTAPLLAEAKAALTRSQHEVRRKLSDCLARSELARKRLLAHIPTALDLALPLLPDLLALDPTAADDPELNALPERLDALHQLHAALEAALAEPGVPVLERAFQALRGSIDRLTTSEALLEHAASELGTRREQLTAQISACAEVDLGLVDLALPAFETLLTLDPEASERAQLEELRADYRRLSALHRRLEGLARSEPGTPGLKAEAAELRAAPRRLCGSLELADAVAGAVARWRERRARQRLVALRISVAIVALLAVVVPLWWRDAHARTAVLARSDDVQAVALARAYAADWTHPLYRAEMAGRAEELSVRLDQAAWAAAHAPGEPAAHAAALERYLAQPGGRHFDEARTALQAARLAIEDQAIAAANAVGDPAKRIAALEAYIAGARIGERAAHARNLVVELKRARDEAAWQAVQSAASTAAALPLIEDYLALSAAGPAPAHREEALALRVAITTALARQRDERIDDDAWATATQATQATDLRTTIIQLEAYSHGPTLKRHLAAAEARLAQVRRELDDAVWRGVIANPDARARADLLRRYLIGDTLRNHQAEAQTALQEALWATANAPGATLERLARVRAYLGDAANQAHRPEAEKSERELTVGLDKERWEAARTVADLPGRMHAIATYLEGPGSHAYTISAGEEMARCLEAATTLPPEALAALPAGLQARVAVHPPWSSTAGCDADGRWAELMVGKRALRFRYIFSGHVQITVGDGLTTVTSPTGFWLAEQECSQALWVEVLGGFFSSHNPSVHRGDELPVDSATLGECREFTAACNRLLAKQGSGAQLRLPSGAEWHFAAATASEGPAALDRGASRAFTADELTALVWASEGSGGQPRAVSAGGHDHWGLCNLLGNVAEWCSDADGLTLVRGGAWNLPLAECSSERAVAAPAETCSEAVGLRLVAEGAPGGAAASR